MKCKLKLWIIMNWHARCTLGECALRFSALAPFLRARSCEYIVRNSTLRVPKRPEVQEQDTGGAGVQRAECSREKECLLRTG